MKNFKKYLKIDNIYGNVLLLLIILTCILVLKYYLYDYIDNSIITPTRYNPINKIPTRYNPINKIPTKYNYITETPINKIPTRYNYITETPTITNYITETPINKTPSITNYITETPTATKSVSKTITSYFKPEPLGSTFIGLSYEKSKLLSSFFVPSNLDLIEVFKLLGDSVLRIGGNAVDLTYWNNNLLINKSTPSIQQFTSQNGTSRPTPPIQYITPQIVDNLAIFIKATGWKIIYGINMAHNTSTNAADEAAYVASQLGDSLLAIEIGNEPDLYMHINYNKWKYKQYCSEWEKYANEIRIAVSQATNGQISKISFIGPSSAFDVDNYSVPFAKDESENIQILGHHYYRGNGKASGITATQMLSNDSKLENVLIKLNKASKNNKIVGGYRLAECNSYYDGGAPGLSNSYPSALWVIIFAMTNIVYGSRGINLHGGGHSTGYTVIADFHNKDNSYKISVRPTYYGLLLVSQSLINNIISASRISNNVYRLIRGDNGENYVIINTDPLKTIVVNLSVKHSTFSKLLLSGDSTSITINGSSIDKENGWKLNDNYLVNANINNLEVEVLPYTALLLSSK